jgi:hypothetical protein
MLAVPGFMDSLPAPSQPSSLLAAVLITLAAGCAAEDSDPGDSMPQEGGKSDVLDSTAVDYAPPAVDCAGDVAPEVGAISAFRIARVSGAFALDLRQWREFEGFGHLLEAEISRWITDVSSDGSEIEHEGGTLSVSNADDGSVEVELVLDEVFSDNYTCTVSALYCRSPEEILGADGTYERLAINQFGDQTVSVEATRWTVFGGFDHPLAEMLDIEAEGEVGAQRTELTLLDGELSVEWDGDERLGFIEFRGASSDLECFLSERIESQDPI